VLSRKESQRWVRQLSPGRARPLAEPGNLGYLLLGAAGVALLGRRRWPSGVFVTTAGLSLAYYAAGYPDGPGVLGLLVAIYSVAVQGDPRRSPRTVVAGIAVLGVGWLLAADLRPFNAAGWVLFRLAAAVAVAALGPRSATGGGWRPRPWRGPSGPSGPGSRRRGGGWTPSGCGSPGRSTTPSPTPSPSSTCRPG
jgi:hypothetical protein